MNKRTICGMVVSMGLLLAGSSVVAGETLDAAAIKALFTDKTVRYTHEKKGYDITAYYSPDGTLRGVANGKPTSGTWNVTSGGHLCVKREYAKRCRIIVLEDGVYKKYKVKHNDHNILLATYHEFIDGNPNNY